MKMKIIETIFDDCYVIEPSFREDSRGIMEVFYRKGEQTGPFESFEIKEQRVYKIPSKHTFFGIHYQSLGKAQGKLISVIQGRALDYIVDLRTDSATFKQFICMELDAEHPKLVYIAPGFGHGFLTLEDNTIQMFAIDADFRDERSGVIHYMDPEIGLHLPVDDIILSDYDRDALFLKEAFHL